MKAEIFKKLIKEAVRDVVRDTLRDVIREELAPIKKVLVESYKTSKQPVQTKPAPIQPTRSMIESIGLKPKNQVQSNTSADPVAQILAETARGMTGEDYRTIVNAGSGNAQGFSPSSIAKGMGYSQPVEVVKTADEMISSAVPQHPVNNIDQVTIDTVPDFSDMMKTLKNKGKI